MTGLHVVFGGGQVGRTLAETLLASGAHARIVKRSQGSVPPGVEFVQGDAADPAFCIRAAQGAAALYHCVNPPYDAVQWAEYVPRFMDNLVAAASRSGARLVVLDNLYMLGRPGGRPLDEETPPRPCSRKGEIRARAAERLFEAHRRGDLRAVAGRASDFYGPRGTMTMLGDVFWKPVFAGKTVRMPFDPDMPHTYHYIPDVAAALAALGSAPDDAYGRAWMLPCAPAGSTRGLVARVVGSMGREVRIARAPRWTVKAIGAFVPIVREIGEMLYQWEEPFVVDDRRFRERFGLAPTDPDEAAGETAAWARRHYGAK
jgi:nucleoside-diphosphate-sugar epimerase